MGNVGVVGFAFGLRAPQQEPNPCNKKLGREVERVVAKYAPSRVVVQWEIAKFLERQHARFDREIGLNPDGSYLDSKGVWEAAKEEFEKAGVTDIVVVAQPFLHLPSLKGMIRADGYTIVDEKIGHIGFDNSIENTQPWTRGPFALLRYAVKLKVGFSHGHSGRQTT